MHPSTTMSSSQRPAPKHLFARIGLFLLIASGLASQQLVAQTPPNTATISGVVSNVSTQQFLTDAEVRVVGTKISALTDRDGSYTLRNLAPGTYQLEVSYTGLDTEKRSVTVAAGQNAKEEFNLNSGIYKLDKFIVASEAEGNAAQINKQKKADYFMESVSADSLGSVPDGNLGEFLRYVPGLQVNYVNADASTVSMRGQEADATAFTFDGQIPAAAGTPPRSSTGSSDASSRAFEFNSTTINNIESIEVYKAPTPWMAPASGGVVNAVTRNAFLQKGRRFSTALTFSANSEMMHWEMDGPGSRKTQRFKPGVTLNYSEALLHNTLGVSLSYQETNSINPSHNYGMTYSPFVGGTAAVPLTDDSRFNVNTFTLVDGPQAKNRRNMGMNLDYRLGAHTVLKLNTSYNSYLSQNRGHTFRVKPGTIDAASTTTDAIIRNAGVDVFDDYSDQVGEAFGYVGAVEHKFGPWKINYSANYSKSDSHVTDLPAMIQSVQYNLVAADGVVVHMTARPDVPAPVTMVQTAGPDLYDLASYKNTTNGLSLQTSPRFQNDRTWNLKADVVRNFSEFRMPFDIHVGTSLYQLHRRKTAGQIVLNFVGPDGIAATGDEILPASLFNDTTYGDKFLYGIRTPPLLDPYKVAVYMKQNPLAMQDLQGTNIQRQRANAQKMEQDITSAYAASTIKVTNKLTVLTGVRFEQTENFVRGAIRINSLGVGLPNNSKQFFDAIYSQTQRATSKYTDYFPNLQTTYRFTDDIILRAALTRSMRRPDVQQILPNTTINDTSTPGSVTVNNASLKPQYSRNIDVGLDIFTRPSGNIKIGWFKKTISSSILTERTTIDAGSDNGFDGQYAGYTLNTQENGGKGQYQGFEGSIRQQLQPFLGKLPLALQNWVFNMSYTYNTEAQRQNAAGVMTKPLAPGYYKSTSNYELAYTTPTTRFGKLYIDVRTSIQPKAIRTLPSTTDLRPVFEARHQRWDATTRWDFNRNYSLEFVAGNITDDSFQDTFQGGRETSRRTFGTTYLLTFRANLADMRMPFMKN